MARPLNEGFRLIFREGEFTWTHPLLIQLGDVDCTDMSDEEFEVFVVGTLSRAPKLTHTAG